MTSCGPAREPVVTVPNGGLVTCLHTIGPADGWQRRTVRSQVLTLFPHGGIVEHALDGFAPRHIVIPRGGVVSSLRGVPEAIRMVHDTELFAVQLSDAALQDAAAADGCSGHAALLPSPGISNLRLTGLMMALRTAAGQQTADPLVADSLAHALALLVATDGATLAAPRHALSSRLAARVAAAIDDRLAEPLRLVELAAETAYSVAQFTRLFRATFGTSPLRYVTARRIDRACSLLRSGCLSQLDIALACGFQSQQHFSRAFHAHVGMTPNTYRRK